MTLAVTGIAGALATCAMAAPAQAQAPHSCSFGTDRLAVEFAHPYDTDGGLDQPLSVTANGSTTCTLNGRAKVRLLDASGAVLPYRIAAGADGVTTEVGPDQQAVFDLYFATGGGHHATPAKIRVTLPDGGGSRVIDWASLTPASRTITVDGFRPWLD